MGKPRCTDLAPVRPVGTIGNQVYPELPLGRLDRRVDVSLGDAKSLRVEFEMMDERFHRTFHFTTAGWNDFIVSTMDWSLALRAAQHFKALLHDAHRLAHLFHADTVSVVTV